MLLLYDCLDKYPGNHIVTFADDTAVVIDIPQRRVLLQTGSGRACALAQSKQPLHLCGEDEGNGHGL